MSQAYRPARRDPVAEAEAQRQHAERTQAVFAETGFAEGVRVQVDGAGFGTVIGVTTGLQIRVRVGRHMRDFPRDQLRVVASNDAAPASPTTPPSDELAAAVSAPTPDDVLDADAAPARRIPHRHVLLHILCWQFSSAMHLTGKQSQTPML